MMDTPFEPLKLTIKSVTRRPTPYEFDRDTLIVDEAWSTVHGGPVVALACSRSGNFVASGGCDKATRLVAVRAEQRLFTRVYEERDGIVTGLAFSPAEDLLASAAGTQFIRCYDITKRAYRRAVQTISLPGNDKNFVTSLAFHPGGNAIIAGTKDGVIFWIDRATSECYVTARETNHHRSAVTDIKFSDDGSVMFSVSRDGTLSIWDAINNMRVAHVPKAHQGYELNSASLEHASQQLLLTAGNDGFVRLWDLRQGEALNGFELATAEMRRSPTWDSVISNNLLMATTPEETNPGIFAFGKCLKAEFMPPSRQHPESIFIGVLAGVPDPIVVETVSGVSLGQLRRRGTANAIRVADASPCIEEGSIATIWNDQRCRMLQGESSPTTSR